MKQNTVGFSIGILTIDSEKFRNSRHKSIENQIFELKTFY